MFSVASSGVRMDEDDGAVYYRLDVEGKEVANVTVTTEEGYLSVSADLNERSGSMVSSTSLSQRFPLPGGVDEDSLSVTAESGEVIIRLEKLTT